MNYNTNVKTTLVIDNINYSFSKEMIHKYYHLLRTDQDTHVQIYVEKEDGMTPLIVCGLKNDATEFSNKFKEFLEKRKEDVTIDQFILDVNKILTGKLSLHVRPTQVKTLLDNLMFELSKEEPLCEKGEIYMIPFSFPVGTATYIYAR